jgi:hypothetical protein
MPSAFCLPALRPCQLPFPLTQTSGRETAGHKFTSDSFVLCSLAAAGVLAPFASHTIPHLSDSRKGTIR